jgi:uncharacterized protein YecE (DUF72 family)
MAQWAERIRTWAASGQRTVYAVFNNTDDGTPACSVADCRWLCASLVGAGVF